MVLTPGLFLPPPALILLPISYSPPIFALHKVFMKPPMFLLCGYTSRVVDHVLLASLLRYLGETEIDEQVFYEGTYVRGG